MIDLGTNLERAVTEARRIRRNLLRLPLNVQRGNNTLYGNCALASLLLADALGSPASLRGSSDGCEDPCMPHVWNVIDGVIVDITATQFNLAPVSGVLVTRKSRQYHRPILLRGRRVLDYILADMEEDWLENQGHRRLRVAAERLLTRTQRAT
jgi:hypothetical protein